MDTSKLSSSYEYYNNFYDSLSKLDMKANNSSKLGFLNLSKNKRLQILDIGSGYGSVTHNLLDEGHQVHAIEINKSAVKYLEKKGFIVHELDINNDFYIEDKFDYVLMLDVLEHVFDPIKLLRNAKLLCKSNGSLVAITPIYFDLIDRIKILLTGSIISYDNLIYGKDNYNKFKSYNYDHIRFYRPKDLFEMGKILDLRVKSFSYHPLGYLGNNIILKIISRILINRLTVKLNPKLFAHSLRIEWILN